jgi:hypothetical protein
MNKTAQVTRRHQCPRSRAGLEEEPHRSTSHHQRVVKVSRFIATCKPCKEAKNNELVASSVLLCRTHQKTRCPMPPVFLRPARPFGACTRTTPNTPFGLLFTPCYMTHWHRRARPGPQPGHVPCLTSIPP